MTERQQYYKELIAYIVEKHYHVEIDITKASEVPLPNVRMDMVFDIPKENLVGKEASRPFSYWAEVNIVHIKAVNDRLTKADVVQYLGELYIMATSARAKDKSIALTIVSAEKVPSNIFEGLYSRVESTEVPWIQRIVAEAKAYLFTLEDLPQSDEYRCFLPFQPLAVLAGAKEVIRKISRKRPSTQEELLLLFWLRRLQPEFYEEGIEMPRNMVEVINELCPEALQIRENKGRELGKDEEKNTIARNMLRKGLDIAFIAEITGLNPEEIVKLKLE
jgi:hypothetical protein